MSATLTMESASVGDVISYQDKPSVLWMQNPVFELALFHLSGLACLLLLIPYMIWGDAVIFPIYNIYIVFFGLPHNYLTWATILPASSRKNFNMEPVYSTLLVCLIITLLIPLTQGTNFNDWILSFISYYSLWHAYRQHHGICKVYDAIQAKRSGDFSIFNDREPMNLFFGLAANAVLVWAATHPSIKYLLSSEEFYNLIYPQVPMNVFYLYIAATGATGVWALKRAFFDRWRAGKFLPWPQLSLMVIAIATYIVPYFVISLQEMPLAVAIGTIYHNIQYFGFVWLFERHRSEALVGAQFPLQIPQKLCYQGAWAKYFSIALSYSFLVIIFYKVAPHQMGMAFIYFLGIAHYIVDGYIWRKDNNKLLPDVIQRLAQAIPHNQVKNA